MFEQTFKNIDDIFHKDAGCSSELDYTEQSSWMLFLKYLDDLEFTKSQEAELMAEDYAYIIDEKYRWGTWAAPKTASGEFDHDHALTGSDLQTLQESTFFAKEKKSLAYVIAIMNMILHGIEAPNAINAALKAGLIRPAEADRPRAGYAPVWA